ncbi:Ribose-5-phosphate isomerase A [Methylobrevis pamukkalensis]|uniref:Ribose-5-phosphate isomerase A n=1 Tax=Methylobrevis pamukkalensis TaxID=1439726 RepID=A0A1E3H504_9HYPH|nr:Ribose-5-phosphate isomerase A [Methylobrevis pamukkalensis]
MALGFVESGMRLGLGTGSTASWFVRLLAEKVEAGLDVVGVPTSEATAALARELGVKLTTLEEVDGLDLTVDGADEFDPALNLVKGGGGALLREKIVAADSARMIVVADESKRVAALGAFPLPIEVVTFGSGATLRAITGTARDLGLTGSLVFRQAKDGSRFVTDQGNWIVDASFRQISAPEALAPALAAIPGVVEHGLFVGLASCVILAGREGVERIDAPSAVDA